MTEPPPSLRRNAAAGRRAQQPPHPHQHPQHQMDPFSYDPSPTIDSGWTDFGDVHQQAPSPPLNTAPAVGDWGRFDAVPNPPPQPRMAYGGQMHQPHQHQPSPPPPPNAAAWGAPFGGQFPVGGQQLLGDPLFNTARQIGGQFAEQQKERFSKYVSSLHLKYYFAVDTAYVGKKSGIVLFPFLHRDWAVSYGAGGEPLPAKQDVNAPDLYIPLMAFVTYVLVAGLVFGVQKRFSPEQLGLLTTNALFYMTLENVILFVTKYVLNISQSLNIWQSLSCTSYKFVGMVACLLLYLIGGYTLYYWCLAYCILTTVFFLLRSLRTFILDSGYNPAGGRTRKIYLLLSITLFQSLVMWLLTNGVVSYIPSNYDFAQLAASRMGFGGAGGGGGGGKAAQPMMPNGEVDYEELLKMP